MERLFRLVDNPMVVNAAACCLLAGSQGQCVACQKAMGPYLEPTAPGDGDWQGEEDARRADSEKQTSSSGKSGTEGVAGAGVTGGTGSPGVAPSPFAAPEQQAGAEPPWDQSAGSAGAMHRKHMWSRIQLYERYREAFLSTLTGSSCQLGVAAVRVLVALILNMSVDVDVLDVMGVLPHRHRIRKDLLTQLSAPNELEDDSVTTPRARMDMPPPVRPVRIRRSRGSIGSDELASFRLPLVPEGTVASQTDGDGNKLPLISETPAANGNDPTSPQNDLTGRYSASPRTRTLVDELLEAVVGGVFMERAEEEPVPVDGPVAGSEGGAQMVNALCSLLLLPTLPATSICHTAWLLNQLLPAAGKGQATSRMEAWHVDNIQAALRSARQGLSEEVRGMWCDALLPLVHLEWPKARQVILQPALESTGNAVLAWLHAQQSFEAGKALASRRGPAAHQRAGRGSLSLSAQAAVYIHHKVKRLVAMMQVNELLSKSDIPESCSLPAIPDTDIATTEIKESSEVDLSKSTNIRCAVAFAKGQERTVYFTVYGSPTAALTECGNMGPKDIEGVAKSMPVVILAAPLEARANAGTVLSVAPLLGTDPVIDSAHPRWLHLHVRPPVRRFIRAIKSSEQGNKPLTASWQQLVDGHWVLSFPDEDAAISAKALVQEHTAKITGMYSDVLSPMLSPNPSVPP
ncbi:unnamed protein product [Ostreobium quekettii]|uniref:Uncharacterized protein n=1 Tax=Ostreobium quekettii TaxID=121088 RepID=A0A8S1IPV7_9CHLO|nr:unnamed protein product [Ostreobium quekettii]